MLGQLDLLDSFPNFFNHAPGFEETENLEKKKIIVFTIMHCRLSGFGRNALKFYGENFHHLRSAAMSSLFPMEATDGGRGEERMSE